MNDNQKIRNNLKQADALIKEALALVRLSHFPSVNEVKVTTSIEEFDSFDGGYFEPSTSIEVTSVDRYGK